MRGAGHPRPGPPADTVELALIDLRPPVPTAHRPRHAARRAAAVAAVLRLAQLAALLLTVALVHAVTR